MPELRHIPLTDIDEPPLPVRATMDDGKLDELADSIRQIGLQLPIVVIRDNGRYRINTGHRRYVAHQRLGKHDIMCLVREPGEIEEVAAMVAENACREDVNPAEESIWLAQLVEQHGYTEEQLMQLTKHSADYIGDRFRLLRGDAAVFQAVQRGVISFAVARELNKCASPEMRVYFLDLCVRLGYSSRGIRQMIDNWRRESLPAPATPAPAEAPTSPAPVEPYRLACELCGGDRDTYNLVHIAVHRWELEEIKKVLRRNVDG